MIMESHFAAARVADAHAMLDLWGLERRRRSKMDAISVRSREVQQVGFELEGLKSLCHEFDQELRDTDQLMNGNIPATTLTNIAAELEKMSAGVNTMIEQVASVRRLRA